MGTMLQMGKYRIERCLASGGFGNTYVVMNIMFEKRMAMKEFFMRGVSERDENSTVSVSNATNQASFDGQRKKFKKEAQRLNNLHNTHIVQVHDLFDENGTTYYVMDYIDGESLSQRLKRTGKPLSEAETLKVLDQVLDALEAVHSQGIWHLDLKPGNVMMDADGTAKLIDFGASKQMNASDGYTTTTTAMCYTPGYAPLEQIDQKMELIGPWTDLYALGGTLYSLLTCKQPPTVSEL
ncbi:MAG: serine/threonine protein kinase, partial [Muribaculaceae bacterium]|nr:serine/threonine protein kinase [Muribaculaceae bacterium]